jgi:hypothetical protein
MQARLLRFEQQGRTTLVGAELLSEGFHLHSVDHNQRGLGCKPVISSLKHWGNYKPYGFSTPSNNGSAGGRAIIAAGWAGKL